MEYVIYVALVVGFVYGLFFGWISETRFKYFMWVVFTGMLVWLYGGLWF